MKAHYITEDQFPIEISPGVFMLGNYFFNLFLILGSKKCALFETGISAVVDRVIQQLDALGICPDYIICSHPHSDHITGLPGLAARYPSARIIAAEGAAEFIAHPKAGPLLLKEDAYMSKSLDNFGIMPGRPPLDTTPNLEPADTVHQNLTLDLGDKHLDLIKVAGHSPGNLMAKLPGQKILFCSDSLGFHFPGRGFLPLFFTGAQSYVSVLRDIKAFAPSIVCPAHQGPLKGPLAVRGIRDSLETTTRLIRDVKSSGQPDKILADRIFKTHYKDEFTLYTRDNIKNCAALLVKRARQTDSF